ncbi:unnamed protein product [Clonostachys rosea f. rosea IK726]|uniref:Heterokaryon incompatibility domain-containing protein n=3 Tax=Bionectria ochroleuca TaxID=29856 RepID=A0A0B7JMF5_BIOOC|nr:unnamed protein product [Clonostachys rosea f. rosea IK726]
MRLLNTSTLEIQEFGHIIPHYAILSHTWEKDEVLFHDMINGTAHKKAGYSKVLGCCRLAKERGLKWIWIDTLCIDKTSSSELSEAINSMYKWYEGSTICFVYLWDVYDKPDHASLSRWPVRTSDVRRSRWFTRGWTLQELIAPRYIEFYTFDWLEIGTKRSLERQISERTGIPWRVLQGESPLVHNVAERMSWASKRVTTRDEDMAYCLMGFFGVNMPLLYGEGSKAFLRLQEQILKQEDDYTIFMWFQSQDSTTYRHSPLRGAWCSSPADFLRSSKSDNISNKEISAAPESPQTAITERLSRKLPEHNFEAHCMLDYAKVYRVPTHEIERCFGVYEPPILASRGIQISLPLMEIKDIGAADTSLIRYEECSGSLWLAWTCCKIENRLLCLVLDSSGAHCRLDSRAVPHCLIGVDESLEKEFTMSRFELRPSGSAQLKQDLGFARNPQFTSFNVESKTNHISIDISHPIPAAGFHVFPKNEHFILVLGCSYSLGQGKIYFQISCGVSEGQHWCTFDEESTNRLTTIHQRYDDLHSQSTAYFLQFSDRAAVASTSGIQGLILTAAIRRASTHTYQLDIGSSKVGEATAWVKLCLSRDLVHS